MGADNRNANLILRTPSLFRGMYNRVARLLKVDPSYVSRVARGERQSEAITFALEFEMRQIKKRLEASPTIFRHDSAKKNVAKHNRRDRGRTKKTERAA
jgi:hypothetical protein